jgi:enolase-phosphatase E1
VSVSLSALRTRAIVLDIEGTTTPVAFVYQVLFPFARRHAAGYLARHGTSAACGAAVERLTAERAADVQQGAFSLDRGSGARGSPSEGVDTAGILEYVNWLMDRDRKSTGLKALQGLIWQEGYRSGELQGEVYPDVKPAFERWRTAGLDLYIYSSGSVLAQKLLFGSSTAGDLTTMLRGYFDTGVGPKTSPDSYRLIADRIAERPSRVLFVSDTVLELDAAQAAGLATAICVRDNARPATDRHPAVRSFDEILH